VESVTLGLDGRWFMAIKFKEKGPASARPFRYRKK
jgi:hypothetical protein